MKLFGSVDTFIEGAHRDVRIGRVAANTGFLQALLRYGDFDEYHLFCPARSVQRGLRPALLDLVGPEMAGRVTLLHALELPARLASHAYAGFHVGGWSRYHPRLAWMRAAPGVRPFPISGVVHSLDTVDHAMAQFLAAPYGPCDAVACTSTAGREAFERLLDVVARRTAGPDRRIRRFAGRLPVIPLGVADEVFTPRDRAACRASLGLPLQAIVFLWVGRLAVEDKADLVPLLHVARRVARGRDLRLVLAGGADQANERALVAAIAELNLRDHVIVAPNATDEQKRALLGAADVFVSPVDNVQETFGISIAEAMAAGLPVVASDWNGYRDLVEDGVTGFRIPTIWARPPATLTLLRGILEARVAQLAAAQAVAIDVALLEDRLCRLADDPALRQRMGDAGRRTALERWTWRVVIGQYLDLWRELEQAAQEFQPPPGRDPDIVDLFDAFGHYPSHVLSPKDVLRLTTTGTDVLSGRAQPPPLYEDMAALLNGALGTQALRALVPGPLPVSELTVRAGDSAPGELDYALLWLLKHGLVALAS